MSELLSELKKLVEGSGTGIALTLGAAATFLAKHGPALIAAVELAEKVDAEADMGLSSHSEYVLYNELAAYRATKPPSGEEE